MANHTPQLRTEIPVNPLSFVESYQNLGNFGGENCLARFPDIFIQLRTEWITTRDKISRLFLPSLGLDETEMSTTLSHLSYRGLMEYLLIIQLR